MLNRLNSKKFIAGYRRYRGTRGIGATVVPVPTPQRRCRGKSIRRWSLGFVIIFDECCTSFKNAAKTDSTSFPRYISCAAAGVEAWDAFGVLDSISLDVKR
ncbi:MAG: hypothetical protein U0V54_16385 [Saprospiraceae bacterium]|nr:hypothetical protein [Saprospiraceae bacterium]